MNIREMECLTSNNKIDNPKEICNNISSSSNLSLKRILKNNESVCYLHDVLLKYSTLCTTQRKLTQHSPRINSDESVIWIISSGSVTIYRYCDDLKIGSLEAPQLVGLQNIFSPLSRYYFRVSKCAKTSFITVGEVYKILNEQHLWLRVSEILAYYLELMTYREETMTCRNSYSIIKSKLIEYMIYKDTPSVSNKGVVSYISSTTNLSRSSIYRALDKLKSQNLVRIHKGKLKEVNFFSEDVPNL